MKRTRFGSRDRLSRDAAELQRLATGLSESGGKLEDRFWEGQLGELVVSLLKNGAEDEINTALDRLFEANPSAHDELADMIESCAETGRLEAPGQEFDIQLFAAPVLAWSRFSIPACSLPKSTLQVLTVHLGAHVFGAATRVGLADFLFSPDQLPRSFCDTWQLTQALGEATLAGQHLAVDSTGLPETNRFLSDVRYLVGAIAVPRGMPLFRWNEKDGNAEAALKEWVKQGSPNLEPLLTGCAWQPLLADAYHAACRNADRLAPVFAESLGRLPADHARQRRPTSAPSSALPRPPLEEYRIGFGPRTRTRPTTASSGRCSAPRTKTPTPPARSNPCCARPDQGRDLPRPSLSARILRRLRRPALPERRRRTGARRNAGTAGCQFANLH
jgi:hypothetical protein